jgi:hypothetical protein
MLFSGLDLSCMLLDVSYQFHILYIALCLCITLLMIQQDYNEDGTLSLSEFSDLMKAFGNKLAVAKVRFYSI